MDSSNSSAAASLRSFHNVRPLHNAKITITVDCEDILEPDIKRFGKYTSRSGSESVHRLQLGQLVGMSALSQIKVKLIHTCGDLDLDGEPCLEALWNVGQGLVELFEASGRNARCERWKSDKTEDWVEADAKVMVYLD